MKKWNLIVDVSKCVNSNNCLLSTVDEYSGNDFPGYSKSIPVNGFRFFDIQKKERGQAPMVDVTYVPTTCMHCDDAPCIAAAENDAVEKRDDGIVIIDPEKSKGQKHLVDSCPYGAIWWNEELDIPQQWIFDAHLLDQGWKEPRPVQSCPTGALRSVCVTDEEMQAMRKAEGLEDLRPDLNTKPRVHYKNLDMFKTCFVGGTVAVDNNGVIDCLEGAEITLNRGSDVIATTRSDHFGDFKIDQLEEESGTYAVNISHPDHGSVSRDIELGGSQFIGTLELRSTATAGEGS